METPHEYLQEPRVAGAMMALAASSGLKKETHTVSQSLPASPMNTPQTRSRSSRTDRPTVLWLTNNVLPKSVLEWEATTEPGMKHGIQFHLAGLSLWDTISILDLLDVER